MFEVWVVKIETRTHAHTRTHTHSLSPTQLTVAQLTIAMPKHYNNDQVRGRHAGMALFVES